MIPTMFLGEFPDLPPELIDKLRCETALRKQGKTPSGKPFFVSRVQVMQLRRLDS